MGAPLGPRHWRPPGGRPAWVVVLGLGLTGCVVLLVMLLPSLLSSEASSSTSTTAVFDLYDFCQGPSRVVDGWPFTVDAHLVDLEGSEVRVYQYPDARQRQLDSDTIAMNGWSINNSPVEWTGQPHIWMRGSIIVLYLGSDRAVVDEISDRVGEEPAFPSGASSG